MYSYSYDTNKELLSVQIPGTGAITFTDVAWTRPGTVTFPSGVTRSSTYDDLMRLEALSVTAPGGSALMQYEYDYNSAGNLLTKTTEHGMYTYDYDLSSRLTGADHPVLPDEAYTYDDVGNRRTALDTSGYWQYNLNNELAGYDDVDYAYDANGNLMQIRVTGTVAWTAVAMIPMMTTCYRV